MAKKPRHSNPAKDPYDPMKWEIYRRASDLFDAECRAKGALLCFGFGFLSDESKEPYLEMARAELEKEKV